jgi:hypothetical protein
MRGRTGCRGEDRYAGRKHGVGDADIWHAVRTAIRKIDMDDDLTMLIGRPAMGRRWRSECLT